MKKIENTWMFGVIGIIIACTPFTKKVPLYESIFLACGISLIYGSLCKYLIRIINLLENRNNNPAEKEDNGEI